MGFDLRADDALIVVDLQVDFLPGGSLAVNGGAEIVAPIEALAQRFANVLLTQDWHTPGHISFASAHQGRKVFERIELDYGPQVLWPDHCVMGTPGARIVSEPLLERAQLVLRKGYHHEVDSYSGFREADRKTHTGLAGYLRERGLQRLFVVGLATDFCVNWTALDAASNGFETLVVEDLTRAIDTDGSLAQAYAEMDSAGVRRIGASDI
ncbi:bifunctional pyrazinamidase/nicotinamidase [Youhaiella tibetensis]|uniref:nicotinamidase n=1 Tax=Paradevosia tibetensis TaxID=1447062 RepID=A0A5B9DTR2_9HYPH|nr:nicotinamidase [Youhaiella tibetensis]QEE22533.1 nicotinamidase [Youhaiella tibetensis]GGF41436.1 bifunctional pyrazinamidase/nicotinamidase [Youhaiella tibetensis]